MSYLPSGHPGGSGIGHSVVWVNACFQLTILGFVHTITIRHFPVLPQHLKSVTIRCFFRAPGHLAQDTTQSDRRQPCCINLKWSVSSIHLPALTYHQVTFILSVPWWSILVFPHSKMLWQCTEMSYSGSVRKTHTSVIRVHNISDNTWWHMPEPSGWLRGKSRSLFCFLVRNVIFNKKFLNKQSITTYSHFRLHPCKTLWMGTGRIQS
jgi:hypothetical protein